MFYEKKQNETKKTTRKEGKNPLAEVEHRTFDE